MPMSPSESHPSHICYKHRPSHPSSFDPNYLVKSTNYEASHKGKVVPEPKNQTMKTYEEVEVKLHAFLTSPLDGGEWSAWRSGRFISDRRSPCTHWIGGWVGHTVVKRGTCPAWNQKPVLQPGMKKHYQQTFQVWFLITKRSCLNCRGLL
jgi:hypothetical protein